MTSDKVEFLPRNTPSEGCGEVSIKIKNKAKGKTLVQCDYDCLDFRRSCIPPVQYPV
jgi:hypothetical protein